MKVVNAKFVVKPESAEAFLADMTVLIQAGQKDQGCLAYDLYASIAEKHTYMMLEQWTDEAALNQHNQNAVLQDFAKKVPAYLAAKPEINIFDK